MRNDITEKELHYLKNMPLLNFPSHWFVKIVPPFGPAIIRFYIADPKNINNSISVALFSEELGLSSIKGDVWDVFLDVENTNTFSINDTEEMFKYIQEMIDKYWIN